MGWDSRSTGQGQNPVSEFFDHVCERRALGEDGRGLVNNQHSVINARHVSVLAWCYYFAFLRRHYLHSTSVNFIDIYMYMLLRKSQSTCNDNHALSQSGNNMLCSALSLSLSWAWARFQLLWPIHMDSS